MSGVKSKSDLLILTGNAGVGKSTMALFWAQRRTGVAIRGDDIRNWIADYQLRRARGFQEALLVEITTAAAKQFLHMNLHVAIDNVWTPDGIKQLLQNFAGVARVRCVRLTCELKENHRRDKLRKGNAVMGKRVDELGAELAGFRWPPEVITLDTTLDSIEETFEQLQRVFRG